jgi:Ion channel
MQKCALVQSGGIIRQYLFPRRHSALLVALVTLFAVRPLLGASGGGVGAVMFSLAILVLMLVSLYTIQVDELVGERETLLAERKKRSIIGWALAVPATADRVAVVFAPSRSLILAGAICWLLLFVFITWNELRAVLRQKEVTGETISMSISVYLLIGLTWGLFYIVLHHLQPQAFGFGSSPASGPLAEESVFPILIYFSLTTLSTIGFGDITPLTLQARYAAVAEGITGQFYLAILVARLVGLYMSRSLSSDAGNQNRSSDARH